MSATELIATHSNTDFDGFAAMVAAHKLYPEARMVLSGAVNRNVREFRTLFADEIPLVEAAAVDLAAVRRLILVETLHANRLGELGPLIDARRRRDPGVRPPPPTGALPPFIDPANVVTSDDGSLVTLMLRIIAEREIEVTPLEATRLRAGHPRGHRLAHLSHDHGARRRGARLLHAPGRQPAGDRALPAQPA